eukprot:COSAG01_NODE_66365_length_270_cov_0.894737_1_plen_24_part_10
MPVQLLGNGRLTYYGGGWQAHVAT